MSVDILDQNILNDQDEMRTCCQEFVLWSRKWREFREPTALNWTFCRLLDSERGSVPSESGIYTLIIQPGIAGHPLCSYLMYVGKAVNLRNRFGQYLNTERQRIKRPKIHRLLNKYPDHLWFCFSRVPGDQLTPTEDALIVAFMPPANDQLPAEVSRVRGAF